MTSPIQVDLPHKLGAAEAKQRIEGGIGRLKDFIPGVAEVRSAWTGDSLGLQVAAMNQEVNARIDVRDMPEPEFALLGDRARIIVVSKGDTFHFTPSNPWVAVGWRQREMIEVDLTPACARRAARR